MNHLERITFCTRITLQTILHLIFSHHHTQGIQILVLIKISDTILHLQPPSNEPHNIEYPYYRPYYSPPPIFQQYFSGASNATSPSTPTTSMAALALSGTDIDPSNDEANVEEIVGGIYIPSKKWSIEDDELLISGWINCGTDKKRANFWGKVAAYFNEHRPKGSQMCTAKTCSGRWLRCSALLNK